MAKPVRMADIAEKLGISIVSVSKALAGKPGVSEEMRARVAALAKEMGYEPAKARGAAGATNNIGVLVSDRSFSENTFYTNLYRSLVIRSGSAGYTCMMEIVSPEAERGRLSRPCSPRGRRTAYCSWAILTRRSSGRRRAPVSPACCWTSTSRAGRWTA